MVEILIDKFAALSDKQAITLFMAVSVSLVCWATGFAFWFIPAEEWLKKISKERLGKWLYHTAPNKEIGLRRARRYYKILAVIMMLLGITVAVVGGLMLMRLK